MSSVFINKKFRDAMKRNNYKVKTVLLLLVFATFSYPQAVKNDSAKTANRYSIDSCVNAFNIEKAEKTKAGYQYWFVDKNFAKGKTLKMSVVGPGLEVHPPKANPTDEFIFVIEGTGEFYLDGQTKIVGPFASLFYPANVVCGIKNVGKTDLKYLVIRDF
jgi:quercetin dioxygenase-like cupin family protein